MPVAWQLLEALRLTRMMQQLQDVRLMPADLKFLARTPITPAEDSEIMGRFTGYVTIADIIADDQQAVVYATDKISYESTAIPNLKHGKPLTQAMLNQLSAINAGNVADMGLFSDYRNRQIDSLLLGVRQRMEMLIVAMMTDSITYDRLGIKITSGGWGMPSDLKITPAISWDNPTTATPVNDIWGAKLIARVRYGQTFDRITMGTTAFQYMIATTEFQNKARMYLAPNVSFVNLPLSDLQSMQNLAQNVLGMTIEIYDSRAWSQANDGTLTSTPYLAITKVVLTSTQDDNDPTAFDFANGVTTESVVSSLAPSNVIGDLGGGVRGPIAYATLANVNMNPPQIQMWGVARGFPRKFRLQFSDIIDPTAPF
jgi:hypothetical protein